MGKDKISPEGAKAQIDLFNEWYDIEPEDITGTGDAIARSYEMAIARLTRAIRRGRVEIRGEADKAGKSTLIIEQTLANPVGDTQKIIYREVTGAAKSDVRVTDSDNETAKNYRFLAALSGESYEFFKEFSGPDVTVADCLAFLFVQV